jgi:hypothetical protein
MSTIFFYSEKVDARDGHRIIVKDGCETQKYTSSTKFVRDVNPKKYGFVYNNETTVAVLKDDTYQINDHRKRLFN